MHALLVGINQSINQSIFKSVRDLAHLHQTMYMSVPHYAFLSMHQPWGSHPNHGDVHNPGIHRGVAAGHPNPSHPPSSRGGGGALPSAADAWGLCILWGA